MQPDPRQTTPKAIDAKPADGSFQAMDQLANWVRYADTKATILTAAFGVVLTALLNNGDTIVKATGPDRDEIAIWLLAVGCLIAASWTLVWLMVVIAPKTTSNDHGINRFAWPTLSSVDAATLLTRGEAHDVREDAWRQVTNLATLADKKFSAFRKAGWGFAVFVALAVALVATSVVMAA